MPLLPSMATLRTVIFASICLFCAFTQAAALRGPFVSGSRFELRLDGETNAVYLIEQSTNLVNWNVVARDDDFMESRSFAFTNNLPSAFFRARRTNEPLFQFAMAARRGIDFNGHNLRTDSFDSADAWFSDGYGHYTNTLGKWRANGTIACNHTITNNISVGNLTACGRVATGPFGDIAIGVQGSVGDVAWVSDPSHRGTIKPGWWTTNANVKFPSVIVPYELLGATPPPGTPPNTIIDGVGYDLVLKGSPNGGTNYYRLPSGQPFTGRVFVEGHVRLLVTDNALVNFAGTDVIQIKPGANSSLHLYVDVTNAVLGGQGVINNNTATQFYYFGTDRNTSLTFGGNGAFIGVLYAPNTSLQLSSGGSSVMEFSGSAIARNIRLNGNLNFHYDENLLRAGVFR